MTMKHFGALFLLTLVLASMFASTAMAANVCQEVRGNANGAVTFYVYTDKGFLGINQKLTLSQTKGTAYGQHWGTAKSKTYSVYGTYQVTYTDMSTGKSKTKKWYTSSCTLSLKPNCRYKVTVKPDTVMQKIRYRSLYNGGWFGWKNVPTWRVKKTRNITLCR